MSAGMIPALDFAGDATPGQFGPTMRVAYPVAHACAQKAAVSCTGMPSVITMTRPIAASIASTTAPLAPAGGTNTTETSAPVAAIASPTVPNTGTSAPPSSTLWPALRGLVPPTTFVPDAIILAPCFRPSEPVIPWTMIRLSPVKKIAISCSRRGQAGQLGGAPRRVVHGRYLLHHGDACLVEDPAAFGRLVAVQPDHDRVPDRLAVLGEQRDRCHDPVGHRVARGDAAEDIDQNAAYRRIGQHDLQAVRHHVGRSPAADVEEVGRLDTAEVRTRVGDHVQGRHHQAGAIADDPDRAVKLDVIEVLRLGLSLDRVGRSWIGEPAMLLPEGCVVVQRHLAVQRDHLTVSGQDQRIDFDQRGVLVGEDGP